METTTEKIMYNVYLDGHGLFCQIEFNGRDNFLNKLRQKINKHFDIKPYHMILEHDTDDYKLFDNFEAIAKWDNEVKKFYITSEND